MRVITPLLTVAALVGALGQHVSAITAEEAAIVAKVNAERALADSTELAEIDAKIAAADKKRIEQEAKTRELYTIHRGQMQFVPQLSAVDPGKPFPQNLQPRIRRSYADLLATEGIDLGGLATDQNATLKDLKGASFAYSDNFQTREETWTCEAALLMPFVWKTGQVPAQGFAIPLFGVMPSVTLNRYSTNKEPKDAKDLEQIINSEKDELTYRLGFFAPIQWAQGFDTVARLNLGYETSTGHEVSRPLLEAELEPLWQCERFPAIGLGFFIIPEWARKSTYSAADTDKFHDAWFGYQARLRGRLVYQNTLDDGNGNEGVELWRGGFTAELNINPFIFERLILSGSWTYLGQISGTVGEENYAEAGLSYIVWQSPDKKQQFQTELKYVWGAKDYLGVKVEDQLKLSIVVLF